MSTYLALDRATNDLTFTVGGGVDRVDKGRFVVQQVSSKLKTWLGEWALDPNVGWVNLDDFTKNFKLFDLEDRAVSIILGTQGVLSVVRVEATYVQRQLALAFTAKTIHGEIDLTIPWGGT